jgi:hypothetical protein
VSRTWLSLVLASALGSSLSVASSPAGADEPAGARAQLSCRPEAAPGRVLCELRVSALPGARLDWADALVTAAPPFVRPLRARVSPERFAGGSAAERKLSLAFVASESGVGMVTVRSRAVVCRGQGEAERCRPEQHDVQAEVRVGS